MRKRTLRKEYLAVVGGISGQTNRLDLPDLLDPDIKVAVAAAVRSVGEELGVRPERETTSLRDKLVSTTS